MERETIIPFIKDVYKYGDLLSVVKAYPVSPRDANKILKDMNAKPGQTEYSEEEVIKAYNNPYDIRDYESIAIVTHKTPDEVKSIIQNYVVQHIVNGGTFFGVRSILKISKEEYKKIEQMLLNKEINIPTSENNMPLQKYEPTSDTLTVETSFADVQKDQGDI
ncbi:hypothetical protein GWP49_32700, partial [Klebsiella pneumoniae]|nr:hypothetical protein [Klebsiella pneumoniae]